MLKSGGFRYSTTGVLQTETAESPREAGCGDEQRVDVSA